MPAHVDSILDYPPGAITGAPGTVHTNETAKVQFQLICSFANSCARCITWANRVGNYWNCPFHYNCSCVNRPVPPGAQALPFLDYRAEMDSLTEAQQKNAMGAGVWKLVKSGAVPWDEAVRTTRILSLEEVTSRMKLSEQDLRSAGIRPAQARQAVAIRTDPGVIAAGVERDAIAARLRALGLSNQQIAEGVTQRILGGISVEAPGPQIHAVRFTQLPGWDGTAAAHLADLAGLNSRGRKLLVDAAHKVPPPPKGNEPPPPKVPVPAVPGPQDLPSFAAAIEDAAAASPKSARYGETKVFIGDLYDQLKDTPGFEGMSLDAFKDRLLEANQKRLISLGRADLVEAMDAAKVARSGIVHPAFRGDYKPMATFNFVVIPPRKPKA